MATNYFWIGYRFEKFRNQVAIRKKKLISHPEPSTILFIEIFASSVTDRLSQTINYILPYELFLNKA